MITCRSAAEIERMRSASRLVAQVLTTLEGAVAPGVTTAELDRMAERLVRAAGAEPAFKGYRGFPATLCISINEEVIHGIPSPTRALKDGDIVSIDLGAKLNGFYGDSALTVPVGRIPARTAELLEVTRESLARAIAQVRVGGRLSDLGHAVQQCAESHGFSVVREFVGHGIGERLHEEPQIPNYGPAGRGPKLAAGMVLAIEPMIALGRPETRVLSDGWTAVTRDGSVSAHFEHTVAVAADGPLILTAREESRTGAARVERAGSQAR
jgi:methionyl aminopeptidase